MERNRDRARQQPQPRKRFSTKEARELVAAVRRAGGTAEQTERGHFRVTGPLGVALVGSHLSNARSLANSVAAIRREAGLNIGRAKRTR